MNHLIQFKQFSILESKTPSLKEYSKYKIRFENEIGLHETLCILLQFGWGLDRSKIFHRFRILKSESNKYPVGSEFILGMDFNDRDNEFLFYPYCNERPSLRTSTELHYTAHITLI
jgi:hypothetical protein